MTIINVNDDHLDKRELRRERGATPRAAWLAAHSISRTKPWEAAGMCRAFGRTTNLRVVVAAPPLSS
jgi:predicted component of type VI protein secretion system